MLLRDQGDVEARGFAAEPDEAQGFDLLYAVERVPP
jgi:hypothetical protein